MRSTRSIGGRDSSQNKSVVLPQSSQNMIESSNELNESLLNLEVNLRNECEILLTSMKIAGEAVPASTREEIFSLKDRINEEIIAYHRLRRQLTKFQQEQLQQHQQQSSIISHSEQFNLFKLKFNKLILQIERITSSNPVIEEIANRFPRSRIYFDSEANQNTGTSHPSDSNFAGGIATLPKKSPSQHIGQSSMANLSRIISKPPASSNSLYSNNTSMQMKRAQGTLNHIEDVIVKSSKLESVKGSNNELIKRELLDLKQVVQSMVKRVDAHEHSDYDLEIDRLRKENNQIMHDYKILKNDNTEIMHSLRTLSAIAVEVKNQNDSLLSKLNSNKRDILQTRQQSQPVQYSEINRGFFSPSQYSDKKRNPNENSRGVLNSNQQNSPQKATGLYDINREDIAGQYKEQNENRVLTRNNSRGLQINQHERQKSNSSVLRNSFSRQLIPETGQEGGDEDELLSSWAKQRI